MKKNDIKSKLEYAKKHLILAKLSDCFVNNNFVQLEFKALNDEPLLISTLNQDDDVFEYNSRSNLYYVKSESLEPFTKKNYGSFSEYTYDEEISIIEEYLANTVVVIEPYYYYNENKGLYFKNGIIKDIIFTTNNDSYLEIPKIDDLDFDNFEHNEPFFVPNIVKGIDLEPEYLCFGQTIFKTELKFVSDTELRSYAPINQINVDLLELDKLGAIYNSEDSIFIKKSEFFKSIERNKDKMVSSANIDTILDDFFLYTKENNLCYKKEDIYNFYTSLCASQLVILAGMSGIGKTRLPLTFASYFNINEKNETFLFVPITPSYLEPSDVLGFLNPSTNNYVPSQTSIVEFLVHASKNKDKMHMIVFDEMNLSQIEYWFSPFLSLLECDTNSRKLVLYSKNAVCVNNKAYPSSIEIGNNVLFVGTINVDETTKNISDRLKDRSFIINLSQDSFLNYQEEQKTQDVNREKLYLPDFYTLVPHLDQTFNYIQNLDSRVLEFFDEIHNFINSSDIRKGISFRSVKNIACYMHFKPSGMSDKRALDLAFKQTVMQKINGSSEFLDDVIMNRDNSLITILDKYSDISDFENTRFEIQNKIKELRKYGYVR